MTITRISGSQIRDKSIDGDKIRSDVLLNEHIADTANIHESKLDINWTLHGKEILETKKIIGYVQVNATSVSGVSKIDVSALNIFGDKEPIHTFSDSDEEGIIVDAPKNKVILRDSINKNSIFDSNGNEIYGRMTYNEIENKYELTFYVYDSNVSAPIEIEFTMPDHQIIDWQYAQRFNLQTIDEMFTAKENFVKGGTNTDSSIRLDLSSNSVGKGASMIGIEDADNKFVSITVEGALIELDDRFKTNESTIKLFKDEIIASRGSKASIDERLNVSLNEDGTLKANNKTHQHKKHIEQIISNTSIINMPDGEKYVVGDGSLNIYVNGILQANGINFIEVAGGTSIDFGSDQLLAGDVIIIEYIVYD